MSTINKAAVLNPLLTDVNNSVDYIPRATTSEFGVVAIGSGINVDSFGRIYLDTQEYSDRLAAIEAEAASSLVTQQTEVAAAIAQVHLSQSQTITALTLEVNNLKTNLTDAITTTQTDLINRADQLAQEVTDITEQLTQDKAAFTQEIQDALVYLENAESVASALRTARTFTWTGDATGSLTFNGTSNISTPLVLANSGVAAGTYKSVTVDAKGRVTAGSEVTPGMVIATNNTTTANVAATNTNTFLNITEKVGSNAAVVKASTQITGTGSVTVSSDVTGKLTIAGSQSITGNAATATKLATACTIGGVSFDGSTNINLPGVNTTGNQSTSGNAATATQLQTARTINGTSFNGSANITTTNWGTERTLTIGRTSKPVNGSADVAWTADEILPTGTNGQVLKHNGTSWVAGADTDSPYSTMTVEEATTGTATDARLITPAVLKSAVELHAPKQTTSSGNAATATKLQTSRTIGGVSFDGTANINLPGVNIVGNQDTSGNAATATKLATARTINGVSFDGSVDITLPLASASVSGTVQLNDTLTSTATTHALTAAQGKLLNDSKLGKTENAVSATKLATARTINGVPFNGSANITIPTLGASQSWQNLTTSRAVNTTYTNSTGKPIIVNIAWRYEGGDNAWGYLTVDSYSVGRGRGEPNEGITAVIPNGSTYRYESAGWGFSMWREYR